MNTTVKKKKEKNAKNIYFLRVQNQKMFTNKYYKQIKKELLKN